jgi:hypothetical protein
LAENGCKNSSRIDHPFDYERIHPIVPYPEGRFHYSFVAVTAQVRLRRTQSAISTQPPARLAKLADSFRHGPGGKARKQETQADC